jgi:Helix-turn-helix domain
MRIESLRRALADIVERARQGDTESVVSTAQQTLQALDAELVTTTQAAELLGIRSRNTVKALVKRFDLQYQKSGNRMMIPITELARIQDSSEVQAIREIDHLNDAVTGLDSDEPLSEDELEALRAGRPGREPWDQPAQAPHDLVRQ